MNEMEDYVEVVSVFLSDVKKFWLASEEVGGWNENS